MLVAVKQVYLFELLFTHTWIGFKGNLEKLSNKKKMCISEKRAIYILSFVDRKEHNFLYK